MQFLAPYFTFPMSDREGVILSLVNRQFYGLIVFKVIKLKLYSSEISLISHPKIKSVLSFGAVFKRRLKSKMTVPTTFWIVSKHKNLICDKIKIITVKPR